MADQRSSILGRQAKLAFPGEYDHLDDADLGDRIMKNPIAMVKFQEKMREQNIKDQEKAESTGVMDVIPGGGMINSALHVIGAVGQGINKGVGKLSTAAGSPMDAPFSEQFRAAMVPHGPQATAEDFAKNPTIGGALNQVFDTVAVVPKVITSIGETAGPEW
jgi:hypothetical protein